MTSQLDQELLEMANEVQSRLQKSVNSLDFCDWASQPCRSDPRLERRLINRLRHHMTQEAHHFLLSGQLQHLFVGIGSDEYLTLICLDDPSSVLILAELTNQPVYTFNVPLARLEPFRPNKRRIRI